MKVYEKLGKLTAEGSSLIHGGISFPQRMRDIQESIKKILDEHFPHGSGFDIGCSIDLSKCNGTKYVLHTAFHHMNSNGYYDGWTYHNITISCVWGDYTAYISGPNKREIKEFIADTFNEALNKEIGG